MSARRVWVVGAGKRVRETALPALASLPDVVEIAGVFARTSRYLDVAGRRFGVRALADAMPAEFQAGDVVYVAVGKDAVPVVLEKLVRKLHCERLELLIDTPVLKLKHVRHAPLLGGWKRVGVAEDVVHLPWLEAVRAAVGDVRSVTFDRSGYAYHGIAQSRALCGAKLVRARRRRSGGATVRELEFANGARATIVEPRDYAQGRVAVEGARGRVADLVESGESATRLECVLTDGVLTGFRAGAVETRLAREEVELLGLDAPEAGVIARMESLKRVAFRRMAIEVAAGRGAHPLADGLEDMSVDRFLDKLGRWKAGGLCDLRQPTARKLWSTVGKFV